MSGRLLARRQRLVRVRHAQHALAVAETLRAQEEANAITRNAQRVARVRSELFAADPVQLGATFAAHRELADRLERAGKQLEGALYDANRAIDHRQEKQVEASREKEIAQRLRERTFADIEAEREARIAAIPRSRLALRGAAARKSGDSE